MSASGPAIILVGPQMGENIGAVARAMANFGLDDLRLVAPRDGWPNPAAVAMASGADAVLEAARVYRATDDAIGDLHHVYATTARGRDMLKPVQTPAQAAGEMRAAVAAGRQVGVLFGPERSGLNNDDVCLAGTVISIPVNPAFASLNLAQAVLLVAYEWFAGQARAALPDFGPPASAGELVGLFEHLEGALEDAGFFYPPEKRPAMVRNLRNMWQRAGLLEQDVRTLRGVIRALAGQKR
jgi:tRNA/rRNA methyltransferase